MIAWLWYPLRVRRVERAARRAHALRLARWRALWVVLP